jgi:hypothetical protein
MRIRPPIVIPIVVGALALSWALLVNNPKVDPPVTGGEQSQSSDQAATQSSSEPASPPATPDATASNPNAPIDAAARARFNEQAREFFARAPAISVEQRQREGQQLEQELSRMEQAGGMSAGETFLLRAGLIRETVADQAQQAAQLNALKERYENETRRRVAEGAARSDPAFESYKARESEIVAEVMTMQTIPDGLTRDEYLRRRLQAAREQSMGAETR